MNDIRWHEVRILDKQLLEPRAYFLRVEKSFSFKAGQLIYVITEKDFPPRMYSIASGESDTYLGILFDIKKEGSLTPRLAQLHPGDSFLVSNPFGTFCCDLVPAWWIAAGTGIAPFLSMMRTGLHLNKVLIHGGHYSTSFYFSDEFYSAMGNRYIRCCSREKVPEIFYGRVTDYLKNLNSLPVSQLFYLCGRAEMVVDVRQILMNKGVPFRHILAEIFF